MDTNTHVDAGLRVDQDTTVLLGRLAATLAAGAPPAAGLALLVDGWGLRSAVLRRAVDPGEVLAVAGEVLHALPTAPPGAAVELPVPGAGLHDLAVLVVQGARPSLLPALRAAAAVVGLALSAGPATLTAEVAAVLQEADEDADALADALHDGPVQSLVAARYACDAAVRGADPDVARAAVQDAVVALRRTLWHVRPRGGDDLPAALAGLADRLLEAGSGSLDLALDSAAAARLTPAARAAVFRLLQAVTGEGAVRVVLRAAGPEVLLDVDGGLALHGPDRWRRRLRALGGDLSSSAGRLRLALPAVVAAPLTPALPPAQRSPLPDPPLSLLPVRTAVAAPADTPEEVCS